MTDTTRGSFCDLKYNPFTMTISCLIDRKLNNLEFDNQLTVIYEVKKAKNVITPF